MKKHDLILRSSDLEKTLIPTHRSTWDYLDPHIFGDITVKKENKILNNELKRNKKKKS